MTLNHVAIVGLGPSSHHYINLMEALGGRHAFCDETWVINTYGNILDHDRVFHMDDVRLTMKDDTPKIKAMVEWLRHHPGPVYTSRSHPDFPCLVDYPLQDVINYGGWDYLNNSAAYAIAFAVAMHALSDGKDCAKLSPFGLDFAADGSNDAPGGRPCCEYWIGRAMQRGMQVLISDQSSMTDRSSGDELYGYDTLEVDRQIVDGRVKVTMTPKVFTSKVVALPLKETG